MSEVIDIKGEEFRRMQLIQKDMIKELDRVCRENNIRYSIFCGTLLGAVRHKGYIPWDDDADIAMLREDYEQFKRAANQLNPEICFFQDHETDSEYRWGYAKLRRTGTTFIRAGQEHVKCKTGVFIDIFPLDDVPRGVVGQMVQDFYCFCLRKILWSEVGKHSQKSTLKRLWFWLISWIKPEFVFRLCKRMEKKSRNDSVNRVRTLTFPAFGKLYRKNPLRERYGLPKEWFTKLQEYEFEGLKLMGTKDYDGILTYTYGDYMKLPPEEERYPHAPVSYYDFNGLGKENI